MFRTSETPKIHPELEEDLEQTEKQTKSSWLSFFSFGNKSNLLPKSTRFGLSSSNNRFDQNVFDFTESNLSPRRSAGLSPGPEDSTSPRGNIIFGKKVKPPFIDPPLPNIGKTANIDVLIDRNRKARHTVHTILDMVSKDTTKSIETAKSIPVTANTERLMVTNEIYERIASSKTKRELKQNLKSNMNELQRELIFRQSILEVMNANYNRKVVAYVAPVSLNDTRTIIETI